MASEIFTVDGKQLEFNLIGFEFNEYHALATSIERHGGEITLPQSFNANGITIINPNTCHSVNYLHDSINSGSLAELENYCISNLISNFSHGESTISNEPGIKTNISDEEDNGDKKISGTPLSSLFAEDLCPAESPDLLASEDDSLATDDEISGDDGSSTNVSIVTNSDVTFDEEIDGINSASKEKNPLTKLVCKEVVVRCEKLIIDKPEAPVVRKKLSSIEEVTENSMSEKTPENNHRDVENLSVSQSEEDEVVKDSDDDMFITYENKKKSRRNTESSDESFYENFDNSLSERSSELSIDSNASDTFPARKKKKMIHLSSESSSDRDYSTSRSKKVNKVDRYIIRSKTRAAEKSCPNDGKNVQGPKSSASKEPQPGTSEEINTRSKDSDKKTMIVMNKKVYPGSPSSSNDESFETRINKKRYSKRRSPRNNNLSSKPRINTDPDVEILDDDSDIDEIVRSPSKKSHSKKHSAKPDSLPAKSSAADSSTKSTNPKYNKLEVKKEYRKKFKSKINPNGDIIDIKDSGSGSDDNSIDESVNNRIKWLEERINVESHMLNPKNKSDKSKSYEPWEQTGMLWYLIKNNRLHEAKSMKVWQDMIDEGYLTNRSARGLLSSFRSMLNKLEDYNLPENIRKQLANSHS
ncbi:myb-like protein V isoform X2 [Microplitis mediator]|uniref:myb-like protein V isoform X2 n=1 Tax=Microplitis mediator TaxID=375433 RepID=UPI002557584E|nr:myb-like protein V isoform X2 [Microplitis mediator]